MPSQSANRLFHSYPSKKFGLPLPPEALYASLTCANFRFYEIKFPKQKVCKEDFADAHIFFNTL